MLRKYAKTGVARGLHWTGADKYLGALRRKNADPLIICYHRVVKSYAKSSNHSINAQLVSTKTFERQLHWIAQRYDFVSLDELARMYTDGNGAFRNSNGRPVAAITFDDGYADVYENALPILFQKGIPSAVFVVTDTIGSTGPQLHDELYLRLKRLTLTDDLGGTRTPLAIVNRLALEPELERQLIELLDCVSDPFDTTRIYIEKMTRAQLEAVLAILQSWTVLPDAALRGLGSVTWEMLKSMTNLGVTIGSHTTSHLLLAGESKDNVRHQVIESRRVLEENLGIPIRHFAYPDGSYDLAAAETLVEAGYHCAFTTCNHSDSRYPLMTIPRRVFWENTCSDSSGQFSSAILSCQVHGIFDPASRCQRLHG